MRGHVRVNAVAGRIVIGVVALGCIVTAVGIGLTRYLESRAAEGRLDAADPRSNGKLFSEEIDADDPSLLVVESVLIQYRRVDTDLVWDDLEIGSFRCETEKVSVDAAVIWRDYLGMLAENDPEPLPDVAQLFRWATDSFEVRVLSRAEFSMLRPDERGKYGVNILAKRTYLKNCIRVLRIENVADLKGYFLVESVDSGRAKLLFPKKAAYVYNLQYMLKDPQQLMVGLEEIVGIAKRAVDEVGSAVDLSRDSESSNG